MSHHFTLLRCYVILCPERGHHMGSDAGLISWAWEVCINTGLALRQSHHMGNVHNPALSLHLSFSFGLFVFQPAAVSIWSVFHLFKMDKAMPDRWSSWTGRDGWRVAWTDGVDWDWQRNKSQGDQRLQPCWPTYVCGGHSHWCISAPPHMQTSLYCSSDRQSLLRRGTFKR